MSINPCHSLGDEHCCLNGIFLINCKHILINFLCFSVGYLWNVNILRSCTKHVRVILLEQWYSKELQA